MQSGLSPKKALVIFVSMVLFVFAQAVWWVLFMAQLVEEKAEIVRQVSNDIELINKIEEEVFHQQIMIGLEGSVFLILIMVGIWLIYRSLVRSEELKYHQQNFLMAVTHELKTPLASMKIYLDSLSSPKISEEKKTAVIPRMKQDVNRLEKLVENILEAGRFERSGYHISRERMNLSEIVNERLDFLKDAFSDCTIETDREIEPNVTISGDASAIGRCIDAICENGIKYRKGNEVRLRITLKKDQSSVRLTIADDGIGFEPKERASIFERFYRVGDELTRRTEGSGLGLFLCREILQAHSAKIKAHSEGPGKGARFEIMFKLDGNDENHSSG